MYKHITFEEIKQNEEIKAYVSKADLSLEAMGYTDHSFGHVGKCAETVGKILTALNYSSHDVELGQIAAYMHDIGNAINRVDHGQTGAIMAFTILSKLEHSEKLSHRKSSRVPGSLRFFNEVHSVNASSSISCTPSSINTVSKFEHL
jgi:metal-dependent HD superfamily phosphatase/phosphodiesterase